MSCLSDFWGPSRDFVTGQGDDHFRNDTFQISNNPKVPMCIEQSARTVSRAAQIKLPWWLELPLTRARPEPQKYLPELRHEYRINDQKHTTTQKGCYSCVVTFQFDSVKFHATRRSIAVALL